MMPVGPNLHSVTHIDVPIAYAAKTTKMGINEWIMDRWT